MNVGLVIPLRETGADEYRLRNFHWVLVKAMTEWSFINHFTVADSHDDAFNRSQARNVGAAALMAMGCDVLIFLDADTWVSGANVLEVVKSVEYGRLWGIPYTDYYNLTDAGSKIFREKRVLVDGPEYIEHHFPTDADPEPSVGGCVIVHRSAFDAVGGYDERFIGWGEEDRAFVIALETMTQPPYRPLYGSIYHLWHPAPEAVRFDQPFFAHNRALCNRYREASGDGAAMRALVDERS